LSWSNTVLPTWLQKKFTSVHASIDDGPDKPQLPRELRKHLRGARKFQYAEIWVDRADYPRVCALVNGDRAWLMYLRYEGDAGFSSRDSTYAGPEQAMMDFYLSNGQLDEYPLAWTIPIKQVFAALEWFAAKGNSPRDIAWHNDSGDGAMSPNDKSRRSRGRQ
jgi:hypothetical protein